MNTATPARPLRLSPQQRAVIALAREQPGQRLRTRVVAEHFGWTLNKSYKVLSRLRAKGIFHSYLAWVTGFNGRHIPRKGPQGENQLMSWLELTLQPEAQWGTRPDEKQELFQRRALRFRRQHPCRRCDLELATTRYMGTPLCQRCCDLVVPALARAA